MTRPDKARGFSLVELAVVLVIVAPLTSGLLIGVTGNRAGLELSILT